MVLLVHGCGRGEELTLQVVEELGSHPHPAAGRHCPRGGGRGGVGGCRGGEIGRGVEGLPHPELLQFWGEWWPGKKVDQWDRCRYFWD